MKMTDETENGVQQPVSRWESKVVCITGVSPWALAKRVNDVYSDGKWVVGTQVFRDDKLWVALVYYKVKTLLPAEKPYEMRQRVP
jgi:hypothetical protein